MSIDLTEAVKAAHAALSPRWMTVATALAEDDDYPRLLTDMLTAALPHIEKQIREQVARELLLERDHARHAHRGEAANVDHFAHDYCRWVGHAEALTSAAARIARGTHRQETDHE